MAQYKIRVSLLSKVVKIRPNKLLKMYQGGMICLTPNKDYLAFITNYDMGDESGKPTVLIVKDDYRYFPITLEFADENFEILDDEVDAADDFFDAFNRNNEHIRNKTENIEIIF